ncbi:hypothetical protein JTB14_014766 [Gonioctena quinquepunctata]|nr:hypothetical protein JTB14_014766 [Gonioctena quinquepunctata]
MFTKKMRESHRKNSVSGDLQRSPGEFWWSHKSALAMYPAEILAKDPAEILAKDPAEILAKILPEILTKNPAGILVRIPREFL